MDLVCEGISMPWYLALISDGFWWAREHSLHNPLYFGISEVMATQMNFALYSMHAFVCVKDTSLTFTARILILIGLGPAQPTLVFLYSCIVLRFKSLIFACHCIVFNFIAACHKILKSVMFWIWFFTSDTHCRNAVCANLKRTRCIQCLTVSVHEKSDTESLFRSSRRNFANSKTSLTV